MGAPTSDSFGKPNRQASVSDKNSSREQRQRQPISPSPPRVAPKNSSTNGRHVTFAPSDHPDSTSKHNAPAVNTNINPAFGQNQVFTHGTQPWHPPLGFANNCIGAQPWSGISGNQFFVTSPTQPLRYQQQAAVHFGLQPVSIPATLIAVATSGQVKSGDMGEYYRNSAPIVQGASFQPQVPSTQNGPELHYYYPRHDAASFYQPCPQVCTYICFPARLGLHLAFKKRSAEPKRAHRTEESDKILVKRP
jgi:hypothetical protein